MLTVEWGTVPEWFAAVGTVGAFVATWWVIHKNNQLHREQLRESQWDEAYAVQLRVGFSAGPPGPEGLPTNLTAITISNGGKRSIFNVTFDVLDKNAARVGQGSLDSVPPSREVLASMPWSDDAFGPGGFVGTAYCEFDDVVGARWGLTSDHELDRLSEPHHYTIRDSLRIRWRRLRHRVKQAQKRRTRTPSE